MGERPRGTVLVETVRLLIVAVFTAAGYQISRAMADDPASGTVILGAVIGSGIGYVAGGILGRTVSTLLGAAERQIQQVSGAELVAGGVGLLAGLVAGVILGSPLFAVPTRSVIAPSFALVLIVFGALGYRAGVAKREDILQLFGLSFRTRAPDLRVLDSSAILDVRLLDCVRAGFLRGTLLLPEFVLEEVQSLADAPDPLKRQRGRRGLESIAAAKREALADVRVVERRYPELEQVDAKVIALARERGAAIVSNDVALRRIAELQGIEVLSITALANALRPPVLPGEMLTIGLVRKGRERGQGVGYLDDGSMVVVEDAEVSVGKAVDITVVSVVQTSGGRMLFARLATPDSGERPGPPDSAPPPEGPA